MGEKSQKFQKKAKYTLSAIDYFGYASWSLISRSINTVQKIGCSLDKSVAEPFVAVKKKSKEKTKKTLKSKIKYSKKIIKIESTISSLEKRLAVLEKYGVTFSEKNGYEPEEKKDIDDEKKAVLRMLVNENKRLREMVA